MSLRSYGVRFDDFHGMAEPITDTALLDITAVEIRCQ